MSHHRVSKRRTITFHCFGCPAFMSLLATPTKMPTKPTGWTLRRAVAQDAATGVLREVQLPFCSSDCASAPESGSPAARRVHAYLGAPGAPPARVTFVCGAACGHQVTTSTRIPPAPWVAVPLPAPDFSTGAHRVTTLPFCSQACANRATGGVGPTSELVRAERDRLFADRGVL